MAGRKIKDESDAKSCLGAAAASGVSQREWAHRNGIDARSLNAWRVNLARRGARSSQELRLVELIPRSTPSAQPLILRCGTWSIEVGHDSDMTLLARVLEAVQTC